MLKVIQLTYRIDARELLTDASATVSDRQKVGLVGRNGCGKSTFLRLATGEVEPDDGRVERRKGISVGKVSQQTPEGSLTPREFVLAADTERADLLAEAEGACEADRIAEIQLRLADIDATAAPSRASAILAGLGFDEAAQNRPLDTFSGGWRMRVALSSTLFLEPDLLLLDEPSNHLDLESRIWLESHLRSYSGTILLVSHDRRLLNTVCDTIIHLERRRLTTYGGNYDQFELERSRRMANQVANARQQESIRRHTQKFIDRFRFKASKARQVQSKLKALSKMQSIPPVPHDESTVFRLPKPSQLAPPLITIENLSIGYSSSEPVISNLSQRIDPNDRIALLGGIGAGKTTLLRLLNEELKPLKGSIRRSGGIKVGYFRQQQSEAFHPDLSASQILGALMKSANQTQVRARLGDFGISQERGDIASSSLSGGEAARLQLACVTYDAPNLLLLDEPTNHLDMESRKALVAAINEFEGAVVLVTHDLHLVELCAEQLWLIRNRKCQWFAGDIGDYCESVLESRRGNRQNQSGESKTLQGQNNRRTARKESALLREKTASLRKQAKQAERTIEDLGFKKLLIERQLADPTLYAGSSSEAVRLHKELSATNKSLAAAEVTWLDAEEQIESLANTASEVAD